MASQLHTRKAAEPRRQRSRFLGSLVSEPPDIMRLFQSNKYSHFSWEEGEKAENLGTSTTNSLTWRGPGHPTHVQVTEGLPCPTSYGRQAHGKQDAACAKHPGRQLAVTQNFMKSLKPTRQNRPEGTAENLLSLHLFQHRTM